MLKQINIDEYYANLSKFDLTIDARSPEEFMHSHIPNAKNFYALSDSEHKEVGTIYKQYSRPNAKILGASYICANMSTHIKKIYEKYPLGSNIVVYCARGGLRSNSIATILDGTGFIVHKIDKGYKSYRQYVLKYLESFEHEKFIALGGNTGCGKSELIRDLNPIIDLEREANHFGSTFGLMNGNQPSQKAFENEIVHSLHKINKKEWIFIEAESKRIGSCTQPSRLYTKFNNSIRVEITAPLEQRVQRILKDYINIDDDFFYKSMEKISPYIKKSAKEEVIKSYKIDDLSKVAEILLVDYYDNVYKKPSKIDYTIDNSKHEVALESLKELQETLTKRG